VRSFTYLKTNER